MTPDANRPGHRWKLPFFVIWSGQAFSLLGSRLVGFALIWFLTEETGSATVLATATTMHVLPSILFGPVAGALVDRWPRKWTLILSDTATALFTALLGVLFLMDIAQPWHVLLVLFIRSVGDTFQNPAMYATTADMVSRDWLPRVAGMNQTLQGVLSFVAPGLGATLLALADIQTTLWLDVVTAVLAIAPLFIIPVPQPKRKPAHERPTIWRDTWEGLAYMWNHRGLRVINLTAILVGIALAPIFSFSPLLITEHFGGGVSQLAVYQSVGGIAAIVGGVLLSVWGGFERHMDTALLGGVLVTIAIWGIALAPSDAFWLAAVSYGVMRLASPLRIGTLQAIYQALVPSELLGRVRASQTTLFMLATPVGLALAGPIAERVGVRPFWWFAGALFVVITLFRRFNHDAYYIEDTIPEPAAAAADD